jgi:TRAP-type C4-dicarboxylate transport system permease small subunit
MKSSASETGPILTVLRHPLEAVLCALLVTMVAVTFAQVVFRYVLQASLSWSEEVARFLLIWVSCLGAAYAFKTRSHFALRVVVDRLEPSDQRVVAILVRIVVTLFLAVFCWQALRFTLEVRGMVAPATGMSMAVPYSAGFFGSLLMLYYFIRGSMAPEPQASPTEH